MKNIILFSICILCCFSCTKSRVKLANIQTIEVPITRNDKPATFDSLFEIDKYIVLETTSESIIRKIGKVSFYKDNIYILDKEEKTILVFSNRGDFLMKYNHLGQGPGEYIELTDFSIKRDSIYMLDGIRGELLVYNLKDSLLSADKVMKAKGIEILNDGKYALNMELGHADKQNDMGGYYSYSCLKNNRLLHRAIPYNKELCGLSFSQAEGGDAFYHYLDSTFTLFPYNDTIYYVNKHDGGLFPYRRVKVGDEKIEMNTDKATIKELRKKGIVSSVFSFYKMRGKIMFSYYYNNENRKYTIADEGGNILFNGAFGLDMNKLPVRMLAFDSDEKDERILSLVHSFELIGLAKHYTDKSLLLNQIVANISAEDNSVLIFYKLK
ncbi:6-bladed beta-propeller [uncultured Bacteroides sp.]|uniref:6-bladed beta-propeller n=1 Tax=uncultured Bacteroides sp. TaxID=162156 RepID=UPI002AAB504D|nr:6-bladed beta-propeller [uncultured Bacteroides sp.]